MKSARLSLLALLTFTSCGVVHEWNEVQSVPMTLADCYDGIVDTATTVGLVPDISVCDRGLAIWQSKWREVSLRPFGLGRFRLRAEVLLEEGSAERGWVVQFAFEREKVGDPRRERSPIEEDWQADGQDREKEALFGERLRRRVGVKT
ncbi:MAG: hypothetical protein KDC98_19460 [Planctomycetes bacterium]|nr:hypothetical protein [Planctomycetota bacterium]